MQSKEHPACSQDPECPGQCIHMRISERESCSLEKLHEEWVQRHSRGFGLSEQLEIPRERKIKPPVPADIWDLFSGESQIQHGMENTLRIGLDSSDWEWVDMPYWKGYWWLSVVQFPVFPEEDGLPHSLLVRRASRIMAAVAPLLMGVFSGFTLPDGFLHHLLWSFNIAVLISQIRKQR